MAASTRWKNRPEGSTWGDFGPDDQLGRLNLLTPEKVKQGIAEAKEGLVFCLSLPLDYPGGNLLNPRRHPPILRPTLRNGRPETDSRRVFFRAVAPVEPFSPAAVSSRARHYLLKAGIEVPRPGSHTLRHTCVQRLVDAGWSLKAIGDYVGDASPASTEIYSKVAVEVLREVATYGQ